MAKKVLITVSGELAEAFETSVRWNQHLAKYEAPVEQAAAEGLEHLLCEVFDQSMNTSSQQAAKGCETATEAFAKLDELGHAWADNGDTSLNVTVEFHDGEDN